MPPPTIVEFSKLDDREAGDFILKIIYNYAMSRVYRFICGYCKSLKISRPGFNQMVNYTKMHLPRGEHVCRGTLANGMPCSRDAIHECGNMFCGYHRKQYEEYKKKNEETRRVYKNKRNTRGVPLASMV